MNDQKADWVNEVWMNNEDWMRSETSEERMAAVEASNAGKSIELMNESHERMRIMK